MSVWIAGFFAVAAVVATYFSCVRPHLRDRGGAPNDAGLDRQVAELREELRVLRAQDALDSGRPLAEG